MLPVPPEAQAQLLTDVAAFVASIAQIRCQNILKSDFKEQSFIKLIVNDGNSTHVFAHGVSGASLAERRHVEQERSLVERRIFALCEFRDRYAFLLRFLERELSLEQCEETINLYDLVTGTCLNAGYFVKVSLTDAVAGQHCMHTRPTMLPEKVFVGGFALELALLLETPVEKWLLQCEERIAAPRSKLAISVECRSKTCSARPLPSSRVGRLASCCRSCPKSTRPRFWRRSGGWWMPLRCSCAGRVPR